VVIHDLDVNGIAFVPCKADTPLIIDSNAIDAGSIASQQLKLVSRWYTKILQPQCPMQVQELPARRPLNRLKSAHPAIFEERCGVRALERADQLFSLLRTWHYVKRNGAANRMRTAVA
jgi:hypothetical protein